MSHPFYQVIKKFLIIDFEIVELPLYGYRVVFFSVIVRKVGLLAMETNRDEICSVSSDDKIIPTFCCYCFWFKRIRRYF